MYMKRARLRTVRLILPLLPQYAVRAGIIEHCVASAREPRWPFTHALHYLLLSEAAHERQFI